MMNSQTYRTQAWLIAFWIGFLSMSEEILWIRLVAFHKAGVPQAFALVLGLYLLGVAAGAAWGRRYCAPAKMDTLANGVRLILGGALLSLFMPDLIAFAELLGMPAVYDLLFLFVIPASAALKASLFPIAHHLGTEVESRTAGRSLARVYFLNIAGSTMGPLLTGFIFLDYLSTEALFRMLGVIGLVLASALAFASQLRLACVLLACAILGAMYIKADDHAVIAVLAQRPHDRSISRIIENRHGVVHVVKDQKAGDIIYGGNAYDGRTNIDLVENTNGISRAYLLAAIHPNPRRVLIIGLSSGAWARVVSAFPGVERIDIVEINPAYLQLIKSYPEIAPLLSDKRVQVHIDDGRRWLRRHPAEQFDLIVMNTTFHWRANVTNLLSAEFLELARSRLGPSGLMAFNATSSPDVFYTAAQVFPYAYRWGNFIYAAEYDLRNYDASAARSRLYGMRWTDESRVLVGNSPTVRHAVDRLANAQFITLAKEAALAGRELGLITDANMLTEYRHAGGR